MNRFMLGRKAGMTQLFDEHGLMIPVTVIDCRLVSVLQTKTDMIKGYNGANVAVAILE